MEVAGLRERLPDQGRAHDHPVAPDETAVGLVVERNPSYERHEERKREAAQHRQHHDGPQPGQQLCAHVSALLAP